jgi:hypothetical protein
MLVPAWLRNTLHANGIHYWPDKTITIDGMEYIFERGKRINCGSWNHIFHAIRSSLKVYEEIFMSKRVREIEYIPAR